MAETDVTATGKLPDEGSEPWTDNKMKGLSHPPNSRESILLEALGDLFTDDTTPVEEVLSLIHSFKVAKAKGMPVHLAKVTGAGELLLDDGMTSENTTTASTAASTACEDIQPLLRYEKLYNGLSSVRQRVQGSGLGSLGDKQVLSKQEELLRCYSHGHSTTRSRTSNAETDRRSKAQSAPTQEVLISFQTGVCNNGFVDSSFNDSIYTTSSESSEDSSIASGNSAGSFKTLTSASYQSSVACSSVGTDHRPALDKVSPRRPRLQLPHHRVEQDNKPLRPRVTKSPRSSKKDWGSPRKTATATCIIPNDNSLSMTWHGPTPKSSALTPYSRKHRASSGQVHHKIHPPLCEEDDGTDSSISSSDSETSISISNQSCPKSARWHGDVPTKQELGLRRPRREKTKHKRDDPRAPQVSPKKRSPRGNKKERKTAPAYADSTGGLHAASWHGSPKEFRQSATKRPVQSALGDTVPKAPPRSINIVRTRSGQAPISQGEKTVSRTSSSRRVPIAEKHDSSLSKISLERSIPSLALDAKTWHCTASPTSSEKRDGPAKYPDSEKDSAPRRPQRPQSRHQGRSTVHSTHFEISTVEITRSSFTKIVQDHNNSGLNSTTWHGQTKSVQVVDSSCLGVRRHPKEHGSDLTTGPSIRRTSSKLTCTMETSSAAPFLEKGGADGVSSCESDSEDDFAY